MPEERIVPEQYSMKELVLGMPSMKWEGKIDELRSECGAFFSGLASAATGDVSSQITDDRNMGGVLTGVGTLSTAGMKFLLKEIIISSPKAGEVALKDNTTTKVRVRVTTSGYTRISDIKGVVFSSDVRVQPSTAMSVHIGGLRLVLGL